MSQILDNTGFEGEESHSGENYIHSWYCKWENGVDSSTNLEKELLGKETIASLEENKCVRGYFDGKQQGDRCGKNTCGWEEAQVKSRGIGNDQNLKGSYIFVLSKTSENIFSCILEKVF